MLFQLALWGAFYSEREQFVSNRKYQNAMLCESKELKTIHNIIVSEADIFDWQTAGN